MHIDETAKVVSDGLDNSIYMLKFATCKIKLMLCVFDLLCREYLKFFIGSIEEPNREREFK